MYNGTRGSADNDLLGFKKSMGRATTQVMMKTGTY